MKPKRRAHLPLTLNGEERNRRNVAYTKDIRNRGAPMTEGWENEGGSLVHTLGLDHDGFQLVDMSVIDEDELAALIDDVCDHDVSLLFTEAGGSKSLAVAMPYDRWFKMMTRANGNVEPWHGKAQPS